MSDPLRDRVIVAIGDLYDIESELGRGGMSVVYLARDVRLRRRVAIKILPPEMAYRSDVRTRFLREAETAAGLRHPHIVPIYAVDERGGIVYIVMAYIAGESLAVRLKRERLPVRSSRRILREVAGALEYAHARGVVHRDIKPDNILLDGERGSALVTDFGIARAAEEESRLTVTGVAVGTPAYMSPEQAMGERELDGRSDIYSLGVVGYEMVAGEPPFRATNTPAMLLKHVGEAARPLGERVADAPADLAWAIMRALEKAPEDRWPDAGAMRDAMDRGDDTDSSSAARSHVSADAAPVEAARAEKETPSQERWRAARRDWRSDAHRASPRPPDAPPRGGVAELREQRRLLEAGVTARPRQSSADAPASDELGDYERRPLSERVSIFRRKLFGWAGVTWGLALINMVTIPFLPWVLIPAWKLGRKSLLRWRSLESEGLRFSDVLLDRVPRSILERSERETRPPEPVAPAAAPPAAPHNAARVVAVRVARTEKLVRSLRIRLALASALLVSTVIALGGGAEAALVLAFPTAVMLGLAWSARKKLARESGIRAREVFGSAWRLKLPVVPVSAMERKSLVLAEAARMAPAEVLQGEHGATLRRALEDRDLIREVLASLSVEDRALVPEVMPTVDALVERVVSIAQAVHRLDHDAPPDSLLALDARIAAEQGKASQPEGDRRIMLLERQRSTLAELVERRQTLHGQLESASLVLQSLRLDLLKLRSAGVHALGDVTSATQEARALSRDIGHVVDAVKEVRRG